MERIVCVFVPLLYFLRVNNTAEETTAFIYNRWIGLFVFQWILPSARYRDNSLQSVFGKWIGRSTKPNHYPESIMSLAGSNRMPRSVLLHLSVVIISRNCSTSCVLVDKLVAIFTLWTLLVANGNGYSRLRTCTVTVSRVNLQRVSPQFWNVYHFFFDI